MQEEYKLIKDFENYEISNFGNIRNITTGKMKKTPIDMNGYYSVKLSKNNKSKNCKLHRLIAETFILNPDNKECVDHIDRNKLNNTLTNLRWATKSENCINKKVMSNNTSSVSGVCYYAKLKKWRVNIIITGKQKHIGYYKDFDEAVKVRKEQEDIHYKDFKAI
jgi:hypothetical protein